MCLNIFECIIYEVQQSNHFTFILSDPQKEQHRLRYLGEKNALALFYYAT